MTTLLQLAIGLIWIAALHKTFMDGCRVQPEFVQVSDNRWILYTRMTL